MEVEIKACRRIFAQVRVAEKRHCCWLIISELRGDGELRACVAVYKALRACIRSCSRHMMRAKRIKIRPSVSGLTVTFQLPVFHDGSSSLLKAKETTCSRGEDMSTCTAVDSWDSLGHLSTSWKNDAAGTRKPM